MKTEIVVGDTLDFETTVNNYPATDGWTLNFRLVPLVAGAAITFSAGTASNGTDYRTQVAPATSAAWVSGIYAWNSYVTKSGARYSVESGQVILLPDPAIATAPFDNRSHARKCLDLIESLLQSRYAADTSRFTVGDRERFKEEIAVLETQRVQYSAKVRKEDNDEAIANGGTGNGRILCRL